MDDEAGVSVDGEAGISVDDEAGVSVECTTMTKAVVRQVWLIMD